MIPRIMVTLEKVTPAAICYLSPRMPVANKSLGQVGIPQPTNVVSHPGWGVDPMYTLPTKINQAS